MRNKNKSSTLFPSSQLRARDVRVVVWRLERARRRERRERVMRCCFTDRSLSSTPLGFRFSWHEALDRVVRVSFNCIHRFKFDAPDSVNGSAMAGLARSLARPLDQRVPAGIDFSSELTQSRAASRIGITEERRPLLCRRSLSIYTHMYAT